MRYERTSTNLQIVLITAPTPPPKKKIKSPQKKTCPQSKIQKNTSIFPVTWNTEYPPLGRFFKAERFLKKLYINSLEMLILKSLELFEVGF